MRLYSTFNESQRAKQTNLGVYGVVEGQGMAELRAKLISVVDAVPYPLYHGKRERLPRVFTSAEVLQEGRYQDGLPAMTLSCFPRNLELGLINVNGLGIQINASIHRPERKSAYHFSRFALVIIDVIVVVLVISADDLLLVLLLRVVAVIFYLDEAEILGRGFGRPTLFTRS